MSRGSKPRYAVGERVGRFTVLAIQDGSPRVYACLCDCGITKSVPSHLLGFVSNSCGCLRKEATSRKFKRHGLSGSKTYTIWGHMIQRCTNPNNFRFKYYGGRGITVCDAWQSFEGFLKDMGEAPEGASIERVNVNGNYEPSNCRWLDRRLQPRNTRRNVMLTFNGETMCLADLADKVGMKYELLYDRIRSGWDVERAVTWRVRK